MGATPVVGNDFNPSTLLDTKTDLAQSESNHGEREHIPDTRIPVCRQAIRVMIKKIAYDVPISVWDKLVYLERKNERTDTNDGAIFGTRFLGRFNEVLCETENSYKKERGEKGLRLSVRQRTRHGERRRSEWQPKNLVAIRDVVVHMTSVLKVIESIDESMINVHRNDPKIVLV
jgi:hypothetical protein